MAYLILLRHGESAWNQLNVFTGWVDIPLSAKGVQEALEAGQKIAEFKFDLIYTSTLVRAMQTTMLCMQSNKNSKIPVVMHKESKQHAWEKIYNVAMLAQTIPVYTDWHLNERYYGELQGYNKAKTAELYGEDKVHLWRRSYDVPPPNGECLQDTAKRTIPFFKKNILPALLSEKNVLVVAHGNSLRSIVMYLDQLTSQQILDLELSTGVPIIYNYTQDKFNKIL